MSVTEKKYAHAADYLHFPSKRAASLLQCYRNKRPVPGRGLARLTAAPQLTFPYLNKSATELERISFFHLRAPRTECWSAVFPRYETEVPPIATIEFFDIDRLRLCHRDLFLYQLRFL